VSVPLHIEALLFSSDKPVTVKELRNCLNKTFEEEIPKSKIISAVEELIEKYDSSEFAIQVKKIADGYTFMTKSNYHDIIVDFLKISSQKKLTTAALETLSIIAYKQPITKPEMESIRGVNSDYTIQKLLDKELVEIKGRKDGPGKPLLYGTSRKFMDYFDLRSIADLPKIRDFEEVENTIGKTESIESENGTDIN